MAGIASVLKPVIIPSIPAGNPTTFPRVKVSSLSEVAGGTAIIFNYPLDNEPNLLVKAGQLVSGGVGPDGDIVAFSQICQHLGCYLGYVPTGHSPSINGHFVAQGPVGYCPCHGSIFDFADGAKVIGGPSPRPQPQVVLQVDASGDIYATGMGPPTIFDHDTGSNDVSADLQGGKLVKSP